MNRIAIGMIINMIEPDLIGLIAVIKPQTSEMPVKCFGGGKKSPGKYWEKPIPRTEINIQRDIGKERAHAEDW